MSRKINLKTSKNKKSVASFLNAIENTGLRKDCKTLLKIFKAATGTNPIMWGSSIIGFGEYDYKRSNGADGVFMATGFSPRKSGPTIYIMPGYQDYSNLMKKLGPHKIGKSCLYLKNLEDIDIKILKKIIVCGLKDLKKTHTVRL